MCHHLQSVRKICILDILSDLDLKRECSMKLTEDFIVKIENKVKLVLSSHSKIDKTKVLKTDGCLMQVESIAECSLGAFCNTFDLH